MEIIEFFIVFIRFFSLRLTMKWDDQKQTKKAERRAREKKIKRQRIAINAQFKCMYKKRYRFMMMCDAEENFFQKLCMFASLVLWWKAQVENIKRSVCGSALQYLKKKRREKKSPNMKIVTFCPVSVWRIYKDKKKKRCGSKCFATVKIN